MTFHANCLHEMSKATFSGKNKKNNISLSSAELNAQGVVTVNLDEEKLSDVTRISDKMLLLTPKLIFFFSLYFSI